MNRKSFLPFFLLFLIFFACQPRSDYSKKQETTMESTLDMHNIAAKIIEQADLQAGEKVVFMMAPGDFDPIISILEKAVKDKAASYLGTISVTNDQPEDWSTDFTRQCADQNISALEDIFQAVDLGIMLPGAAPTHAPYKALQNILENSPRRTIHFHWAGAYDLNGQLLDIDPAKALYYQDVVLNTDYHELAAHQRSFEQAMRDKTMQVSTPGGTDLRFEIGSRPVTKQDGNASAVRAGQGLNLIDREIEIPSGAIRVAPMEETVEGTIAFPDADWSGTRVNGLVVTIQAGKIIQIQAESGKDAVENELAEAGEAGRSFREFALGFNPLMPIQTSPSPWIPYYGYGAGVVRLSLGDNTELGGKVGGGYVRWNFFTDATVMVGDEKWVEDGKLIR